MSRCSVKMIRFSSRDSGLSRSSRSLSNFDSSPLASTCVRQVEEGLDLLPLRDQLREGNGDDTAERLPFGDLVFLLAVLRCFFVAGLFLEHVLDVVEIPLHRRQLIGRDFARLDRLDEPVELLQTTLERPQQGVGRAGQPALEDGHGEAGPPSG